MEDLEDFPEKLSLAPSIKKVTKKGKTKQKVNKIVPKLEIMEDFDEEKPPRVA